MEQQPRPPRPSVPVLLPHVPIAASFQHKVSVCCCSLLAPYDTCVSVLAIAKTSFSFDTFVLLPLNHSKVHKHHLECEVLQQPMPVGFAAAPRAESCPPHLSPLSSYYSVCNNVQSSAKGHTAITNLENRRSALSARFGHADSKQDFFRAS